MSLLILWAALVALSYAAIFVVDVPLNRRRAIASGAIVLQDKMNTLSIVAFVTAFFVSVASIVLGHIALSQIKRTNERGWGLSYAALVIGYCQIAAVLALLIFILVFVMTLPH